MDVSNIHLTDLQRILMGDAPYTFLLEVMLRTLFIYFVLLVVIRFMGKRMSGQLTIMEMAVMISLGAIISVPAQVPDRGLLQGVLLLFMILAFQRGLTRLTLKSNKMEWAMYGQGTILVKDGIIQVSRLGKTKVTRPQLFAILRSQHIYHLGMVKRVYQEATGDFSIYTAEHPKPGLSVLPSSDSGTQLLPPSPDNIQACKACGNTDHRLVAGTQNVCMICGNNSWEPAVG
jgi:uncharacterized membrane protein YcaP (DUF421 family)